jgi:hypothetical protein
VAVTILAMLIAVACVAASFERLRRVHDVADFDLALLCRALGRNAGPSSLREMRDVLLVEGESWEGELLTCALDAGSSAERTALLNERLGDVESRLRWGNRIPVVAARLSGMSALCVLFFAVAGGGVALADIVPVVAWGGGGLVASLATGREADRVATDIRRSIDAWVARVLDAVSRSADPSEQRRGGS